MIKECGCETQYLCKICIKDHKGSLYGYHMSLDTFINTPMDLSMKTYDSEGNLIKEETKPFSSSDMEKRDEKED